MRLIKLVNEAKPLAAINKNIVIKIPMCAEGLKAVKKLTALGIKTNVTLIFSAAQALLACKSRRYICKSVPWQT